MSRRRVQLVILCEDIQHRAFAKGLFEARGFRNIRFLPIPEGKGAATLFLGTLVQDRSNRKTTQPPSQQLKQLSKSSSNLKVTNT